MSGEVDATQHLIDTLRKHTGQGEEEARETIARALDRALECPSGCGRNDPCPDPWHDRKTCVTSPEVSPDA